MLTQIKRVRCGLGVAVCFLVLAATVAKADAPLRWKFKSGDSFDYVIKRGTEGKMSLMGGGDLNFKIGMTFDVNWKVQSASDSGTGQLELVVDRIQLSMASPLGGDLNFDSSQAGELAGPAAVMLGPVIDGMLGQKFSLKVSPLGEVSDIQLPEKLAEVFKKQQTSQNRGQGFGPGGSGFSERGIKELITRSVLPLPEAAPSKDVTWKQHFENPIMKAGMQMTDVTYSYAGDDTADGKTLAKIAAQTELTFEPEENPMADIEITSQEGKSTFYFDAAAGKMTKAEGVQTFVMEITGPREMTQDVKETWNMSLGKSPPAEPKAAKAPAKQ